MEAPAKGLVQSCIAGWCWSSQKFKQSYNDLTMSRIRSLAGLFLE